MVPPLTISLRSGEEKPVVVRVDRKGFTGPVKIELKNLPSGVEMLGKATVSAERDKVGIRLRAAYTVNSARTPGVKVIATAEELA